MFNLIRQEFGITYAFLSWRCVRQDTNGPFFMFAIFGSVLGFLPIAVLMFKWKEIRERLGVPKNALDGANVRSVELDKLGEEKAAHEEDKESM